jgi:hypothetical protein
MSFKLDILKGDANTGEGANLQPRDMKEEVNLTPL